MIKDFHAKDVTSENKLKIPELVFHTMTWCGQFLTIYGGMTSRDTLSGDLYFLRNTGTNIITASYDKNKNSFPIPRFCHSADYDPTSKRLFFFGGYTFKKPHFLNQLCVLELKGFAMSNSRNTIVFQSIKSVDITGRCRHCSFLLTYERRLYIYGGYGINKYSKELEILNDFYYIDLDSGMTKEVTSKGGDSMSGHIFNVTPLNNSKYAFLTGDDLSKFYIFDPNYQTFTRIPIRYECPAKRDYFTVTALSDNRIVLFGGSNNDRCFFDVYVLSDYPDYDLYNESQSDVKDIDIANLAYYYQWNRYDTFGRVSYGYNGHCALLLENDRILIEGGTENSFDGLYPEKIKQKPVLLRRLHVLDLMGNYFWYNKDLEATKALNDETEYMLYDFDKQNEGFKASHSMELSCIQHVMAYIPKEYETFPKFFLHGGRDKSNRIIRKCHLYSFKSDGVQWDIFDDKTNPQLMSHACSEYMCGNRDFYIILSGGITYNHSSNCPLNNECGCEVEENEYISGKLYYYLRGRFKELTPTFEENDNPESLKRYGHSMVTIRKDKTDLLYIIGGFVLNEGYPSTLIQIQIFPEDKKKKFSETQKDTGGMSFKMKEIELENFGIVGRIYASATVVLNHIVLFGGIIDDVVLNDMHIINVNDIENITVQEVILNENLILPRFGMSSVFYQDIERENVGKIIIFGGRFLSGEKNVQAGLSNQLLVFWMRYLKEDRQFLVEGYVPTVYGFSEKRVKHTAKIHDNKMYVWGLDTKFQILDLPFESFDIEEPLNEYIINNRQLGYIDWEDGLENRKDKNWLRMKNVEEVARQKAEQLVEKKLQLKNIVEEDDGEKSQSNRSVDKLMTKSSQGTEKKNLLKSTNNDNNVTMTSNLQQAGVIHLLNNKVGGNNNLSDDENEKLINMKNIQQNKLLAVTPKESNKLMREDDSETSSKDEDISIKKKKGPPIRKFKTEQNWDNALRK